MNVVKVSQQDYPALITLWEASVRATHHFLPEPHIAQLKPLILEHYFDAVSLGAIKKGNEVAGFIGVAEGNIEMLFVHPDFFGEGIGRALTLYAIHYLGASKVDVNEQNPQAIGFYEYMGFKRTGRSALDGQGNPFPLIHMATEAAQ
ncbi:GNAT family N-acetyltransferase [Alteromonas sp. ZYF713]|nr:GNAT family N-acetyltransferase [Alteromonas sp. ZYF713]